jgi:hypothetical protein
VDNRSLPLFTACSLSPLAEAISSLAFKVDCFLPSKKYNPHYNLLTMILHQRPAKLEQRENSMNEKENRHIELNRTDQEDKQFPSGGSFFEIRVKGHLDRSWSDWLEGLNMKLLDNGEMILFGYIADQAALIGILNKIYRLNLTLLSVSEGDQKEE